MDDIIRNIRFNMFRLFIFIFLLITHIPASFAVIKDHFPTGVITDYGIAIVSQAPQQIIKDKASPSGEIRMYRSRSLSFIEKTTRIPAKRGVRFGVSFVIQNLGNMKKIPLQWKIIHPKMNKPDGTTSTVQIINRKFPVKENGVVTGSNTYLLKYDYEVLPGEWMFEFSHQGQLLFFKKFIIYK